MNERNNSTAAENAANWLNEFYNALVSYNWNEHEAADVVKKASPEVVSYFLKGN
jgi:uncharacterized protein YcbX